MRDSFLLYTEIGDVLKIMTNEQKGILFQAIIDYERTDEEPVIEDPIVAVAFVPVRQNLDRNNAKYERAAEQRREASKKAAEARKEKAIERNRANTERNRPTTERNRAACVNENVNGNVNDNVNENENVIDITPHTPHGGKRETQDQILDRLIIDQNVGLEMENAIREWLKYKSERREVYKETGMKSLITQVQNAVYKFGEIAVMDRMQQAMANGWKGMNLDKMEGRASPQSEREAFIDKWRDV